MTEVESKIVEVTEEQANEIEQQNESQTNDKVLIENEEDQSNDDEVPELEDGDKDEEKGDVAEKESKQSRQEKKARKSIAKLGLKPVPGVTRVVSKKPKQ